MRITKEDGKEMLWLLRLLRVHVESVAESHTPAVGDEEKDIVREAREDLARVLRLQRRLREAGAR